MNIRVLLKINGLLFIPTSKNLQDALMGKNSMNLRLSYRSGDQDSGIFASTSLPRKPRATRDESFIPEDFLVIEVDTSGDLEPSIPEIDAWTVHEVDQDSIIAYLPR